IFCAKSFYTVFRRAAKQAADTYMMSVTTKRADYIVRQMGLYDNDQVLDILSSLGITVGNHTNITMLKVDSHCLFVAEDTDTGEICGAHTINCIVYEHVHFFLFRADILPENKEIPDLFSIKVKTYKKISP